MGGMKPDQADSNRCLVGRAWARLNLPDIHCLGSIYNLAGPLWISLWGRRIQAGKWNRRSQSGFHCHRPVQEGKVCNGPKRKHPCLENIFPWGTAFTRLPLAHSSSQGCKAFHKGSLLLPQHHRGSLLRKNQLWYQQQNPCSTIQQGRL